MSSSLSFLSFHKVIWRSGGCVALTCSEPYVNFTACQSDICFLLFKVTNQSQLPSHLSHMLPLQVIKNKKNEKKKIITVTHLNH